MGEAFKNPFRSEPISSSLREAVQHLQGRLQSEFGNVLWAPGGGKMFGVLRTRDASGAEKTLCAFSGMLNGRWTVEGFVPPLFDQDTRERLEMPGEALIKKLNRRTEELHGSPERAQWIDEQRRLLGDWQERRRFLEEELRVRKAQRALQRQETPTPDLLELLASESRKDKAQKKRFEHAFHLATHEGEQRGRRLERRIRASERLTRYACQRLMRGLFDTYTVENFQGERCSLRTLFQARDPPSGTGDCAFPKLLAHAQRHGLLPIEGAEFFFGNEPVSGARRSGVFYPPCKDKCEPLLAFMLKGLELTPRRRWSPEGTRALQYRVIFQDEWLVVLDKPAGLLSVPGKEIEDSVLSRLRSAYPQAQGPLLLHRLDMETSGLLVAALDAQSHTHLQRQFLLRQVEKRYIALLEGMLPKSGGRIELAIRGDPSDRPRQIHDPVHGKPSVTDFERLAVENGCTRVAFYPRTGRTHQLRVHAAHPLGLGIPIRGDSLYGEPHERMCLHAETLVFLHPRTGARLEFKSDSPF